MLGTLPVPGNLSMSDLAGVLTGQEQLDRSQLTALTVGPTAGTQGNLATFIRQTNQLGALSICAKDAASSGTKLFSTNAYISGTKTDIDVYRL